MTLQTPAPRSLTLVVASLLLGAGLAGCVTQDASASTGELYVKDALTDDAAEVQVTFTRAEVLPAQSQAWETVYEGERTIDLLNLSSSEAREKLSGFEIAPGEYSRMRLAVSNVTVVHDNGTTEDLVVFGNMVTVAHDLSFEPGEPLKILMDVDLEKGVNLTSGEFVPVVADVQTSDRDADEDGQPDFVDTDDDDDGIEDADDDDRDGDGQPDLPQQSQAMDKNGLFGLCTAWDASETGRLHSDNATADDERDDNASAADDRDDNASAADNRSDNASDQRGDNASAADNRSAANASAEENRTEPHAFTWLKQQAEQSGQSVDAYCEDKTRPGGPDSLSEVLPENLPDQARQAVQDRHLGPPDDVPGGADDRPSEADRGQDRGPDEAGENRSAQDGNASQPAGNQSDDRGQDSQNRTSEDGNESAGDDGNQTQERNRSDGSPDGRP